MPRLSPKLEADLVCHSDQLTIWGDELVDALANWIAVETYDDKIALARAAQKEIRDIVQTAFELAHANAIAAKR